MNNIIDISTHLKKHDIKPSYQRVKIYQYLLENKIHPTVDTIYRHLLKEIPTLSKTTVYNTLNLFIDKKIINIIVIEENETRYDIKTEVHGHFKCERCGVIYDIDLNIEQLRKEKLEDFTVHEQHHYFKGICSLCTNK